jgi:MYXO-CTERM domain-containing protein
MQPPGAAQNVTAATGESAVTVGWAPPPATEPQPAYYQVLCADAAGAPAVSPTPSPTPIYSVCEAGTVERRPLALGSASLPPDAFSTLDHAFVCTPPISVGPDAISTRISGLSADKTYQFVVVAVDLYGNAAPSSVVTATPTAAPVEPSHGGCSAAAGGGAPAGAALLLVGLLALALRHRRALDRRSSSAWATRSSS